MSAAERPTRRLAWWAWALALATAVALFYTAQDYFGRRVENIPARWWPLFRLRLLAWYAWLCIVPLVLALGRRWPVRGRGDLARVPIWLAAGLAAGAVQSALVIGVGHNLGWLTPPPPPQQPDVWFGIWARILSSMAGNMLNFLLIVLGYHAVLYARAVREREMRGSRLEAKLARAELQVLRMQLHPHFFFNTLHTISALMDRDVRAARRVLTRLGELLRLSLETFGEQEVTLREELEFLGHYLDIQRMRFPDRLTIELAVDEDVLDARVPSLILQPLVENAIRHGIASRAAAGRIEIRAERANSALRLTVADDGVGLPAESERREGLGLANSRERLRQLYGAAQRLELTPRPAGGTAVLIELPYRAGDGATMPAGAERRSRSADVQNGRSRPAGDDDA